MEEINAILRNKREAAQKRERAMQYASFFQVYFIELNLINTPIHYLVSPFTLDVVSLNIVQKCSIKRMEGLPEVSSVY